MEYEICAEWGPVADVVQPGEERREAIPGTSSANRDEWWAHNREQRGMLIPEEDG